MKTISITLFLFFIVTQICVAQWFWQNPLPQGNTLNAVNYISTTAGWAFGDYGTILFTTNGGTNWTQQTSGTTASLNGVSFIDINNGTAVGDYGTILRTINGGINWTQQTSGLTTPLNAVFFTDINNGTAVGDYGKILRTTNGGTNWLQQTSSTSYSLNDVFFTDINKGTAVGDFGKILRTTNGGTNWTQQSSGTPYNLYDVCFMDANNGTAVGDGKILRTTNGGTNWTQQTSGTTYSLYDVSFTDINKGTAVGDNGTILRTTNGGTNWTKQTSNTSYSLYDVSFTDANNGTATGGSGTILRTTNGGTNWVLQIMGTTSFLWSTSFLSSHIGFAVGTNGMILKTINGGTNWTQQTSGITSEVTDLSLIDVNTGFVVSDNGTILKTTNGGTNWVRKAILTTISPRGAAFTDANNGIIVGELITQSTNYGKTWIQQANGNTARENAIRDAMCGINVKSFANTGTIQRTTNGGVYWTVQSNGTLPMLYDVCFANTNYGWAVGDDGTIIRTTNGGIDWSQQTSGTTSHLRGVTFTDVNNGTVVGGLSTNVATILKTTDGGINWVQQPNEAAKILLDVSFSDANNGIAVGDYGTILRTTNGGIDWILHLRGTGYPLFGVSLSDANTGWAVGQNGTILNYSDQFFFTRTVTVQQGWNILSVPVFVPDMRANILFPGAASNCFEFVNTYRVADTLENGKGYWVKFGSNQVFQIVGNLFDPPDIPVKSGWNIVGPFHYDFPVSNITSTPSGITASNYFGFNNGYQIPSILKVGKGYWVKVNQDGVLHLNNLLSKPREEVLVEAPLAEVNFKISDDAKGSVLLKAGIDPDGTNGVDPLLGEFEIPPLPPAGIFDARFILSDSTTSSTTDIRHGTYSGGNEQIHQIQYQSGVETKIVIYYDFGNYSPDQIKARLQDVINGTLIDTIIYGSGSYIIPNPMTFNKLKLTMIYGAPIPLEIPSLSADIPTQFKLEQNYPNPFNGSSVIKYSIPQLSFVTLKIFNSLGEEVDMPVNQENPAGSYELNWNPANLTSGVYFYRLQSGSFTETKKMILIK